MGKHRFTGIRILLGLFVIFHAEMFEMKIITEINRVFLDYLYHFHPMTWESFKVHYGNFD